MRLGIDALRSSGAAVSSVIMAGGTALSPRAAQLRANVWGVRVATSTERHPSLRGAAVFAAVAAGSFADAQQAAIGMTPQTRWYEPDPAGVAITEQRYRRWRAVMT